MTQWLAGMLITADRLNDGIDVTSTTTGLVAATGFSINNFEGRISGKLCTIDIYMNRTGTDIGTTTTTSSNISDTTMCTLPSGYRPSEVVQTIWGNGLASGDAIINTDGTVALRTSDYNQPVGQNSNIRVHASFIL